MCQGLLSCSRHIEKREDPGDEVGIGRHFDDMAAVHDSWSYEAKSNFASLLLQLSNSLTRKELQELKFLCGGVVPRDRLETINHGFELFEALAHLNKLSVRDRDFLASKLIAVNRTDLRNQLLEIEG